jgi:hypothetical protein
MSSAAPNPAAPQGGNDIDDDTQSLLPGSKFGSVASQGNSSDLGGWMRKELTIPMSKYSYDVGGWMREELTIRIS